MTTGRATKATSIARPGRSPPASTATGSRIDGPKINGPLADACRMVQAEGRADAGGVLSTGQGRAVRLNGLWPSAGAAASLIGAGIALWLLAAALLGVRVWPGGPDDHTGRVRLRPAPVVRPVATRAGAPARRAPSPPAAPSRGPRP